MPNYGLVINSKFRPFSYEEMLAPVQQSTEAHIELENAYSDLTTKAKTLESMLNRTTDKNEFDKYQNYLNTINSVSDDLAKNGLNAQARQNLRNLNSAYMSEIAPMQTAAERRNEMSKTQLEARMKDNSLMFSKIASETGLSEFMNNPNWDFESLSGDQLTQKVFTEAKSLSTALRNQDKAKVNELLGGDYYEYIQQRGYTPEEVELAIMGGENADPMLSGIVNKVIESSGVKGWNNEALTNRALGYARQGLVGAIGETKTQVLDNWRARQNHQHALAIAEWNNRVNNPLDRNPGSNPSGATGGGKSGSSKSSSGRDANVYNYNEGKWKVVTRYGNQGRGAEGRMKISGDRQDFLGRNSNSPFAKQGFWRKGALYNFSDFDPSKYTGEVAQGSWQRFDPVNQAYNIQTPDGKIIDPIKDMSALSDEMIKALSDGTFFTKYPNYYAVPKYTEESLVEALKNDPTGVIEDYVKYLSIPEDQDEADLVKGIVETITGVAGESNTISIPEFARGNMAVGVNHYEPREKDRKNANKVLTEYIFSQYGRKEEE